MQKVWDTCKHVLEEVPVALGWLHHTLPNEATHYQTGLRSLRRQSEVAQNHPCNTITDLTNAQQGHQHQGPWT